MMDIVKESENQKTVHKLILLGHIFCQIAFFIPLVNILLRFIHYPLLQKLTPGGWVTMNPLSAVCFLLLAISIWLVAKEHHIGLRVKLSTIICCGVCIICLGKMVSVLLGFSFHLDELLFRHQMFIPKQEEWDENYNTMALNTAFGLFMIGFSTIIINNVHQSRFFRYAQFLNYLTILIAILSIYGYIYDIESLYSYFRLIPISFHSAVTLVFLSSSILFLRPHRGSMALLIGENPTQIVLLRFLAIFIPLILGWAKIYGQQQGLFGIKAGTTFLASCTFAISMILLGWKSNVQFKLSKIKKQYKDTLKRDWERFKRIIELSPLNINIYDLRNDHYIFTNKASRQLYRLDNENLVNRRYQTLVEEIVYKDDAPMIKDRTEKLKKMQLGESDDYKYRVYDKNHNLIWISSRGVIYKEERGTPSEVLFNSFDITSQMEKETKVRELNEKIKKSNEELEKINKELESFRDELEVKVIERTKEIKKSERRYREFIDKNIYEGIIIYEFGKLGGVDTTKPVDEQVKDLLKYGVIGEANPALAKMHSYESPEEMIGIRFVDYLDLDEDQLIKILDKLVRSGYRLDEIETLHATKYGETIRVRSNFIGQVDNGKLLSVWGTQIKVGGKGDIDRKTSNDEEIS